MRFSEVVGQAEAKRRLTTSVQAGRIPHAQLFLGGEGSGNLALALAYVTYLGCLNRSDEDSCGQCAACRKNDQLIHPDLHFSFPFPSKKDEREQSQDLYAEWREAVIANPYLNYEDWMLALDAEKKQGNIPVKECRAIIKSLSLKPFEADYKTLLLWLPEFLDKEGNILLKIIEEPPQKTLFLLVGGQSDRILPTILSRTQLVRVPPLDTASISAVMQEKHGLEQEEAHRLAFMSGGNYRKALFMVSNAENRFLEPMRQWFGYCYGRQLLKAEAWFKEYAEEGRETLKAFFTYGLEILRSAMVSKEGVASGGLNAQELEFASKFGQVITPSKGEQLYKLFNQAIYDIERNGNAKMIFMDISFKMARVLKK